MIKIFRVRLTDFGFARRIEYDDNGEVKLSSTFCGSAAYAAPEIIQERLKTQSYTIFSYL